MIPVDVFVLHSLSVCYPQNIFFGVIAESPLVFGGRRTHQRSMLVRRINLLLHTVKQHLVPYIFAMDLDGLPYFDFEHTSPVSYW